MVARIELDETSPTWETLTRLIAAAGFQLDTDLSIAPVDRSHMLDDVARILALTPEERLQEVANMSRFFASAKPVT